MEKIVPTSKSFHVRQFHQLGNAYFWAMCLLFFGPPILQVFGYPQFFPIIYIAMIMLLVILFLKDAVGVVHADQTKMTVQIEKAGWRIPISTIDYYWKDLESFEYFPSTRDNPSIAIKWRNRPICNFSGNDLEDFIAYLRTFFPAKELL